MSLYIKIFINEDQLHVFTATRLTSKPYWNIYEISDFSDDRGVIIGKIRHKYGHGATVLARKVLELVTGKR